MTFDKPCRRGRSRALSLGVVAGLTSAEQPSWLEAEVVVVVLRRTR